VPVLDLIHVKITDERKERRPCRLADVIPNKLRPPAAWPRVSLLGGAFFVTGSSFFIISSLRDAWIPPYQTGCAIWIGGCTAFLFPVCTRLRREPLDHSAHLQGFCMLAFLCGCILTFCGTDGAGLAPLLPLINALFMAGSTVALLDATLAWLLRARMAKCGCDRPRGLELLDLAVSVCYCVAASMGGYSGLTTLAVCFWAIGSALLLPEPLHAWLATRRGARVQRSPPPGTRGVESPAHAETETV
jgi:hypothetical protein